MDRRAFRPARHSPSHVGPCVRPVGRHGTARCVGRAVPARQALAQARPGLGRAGRPTWPSIPRTRAAGCGARGGGGGLGDRRRRRRTPARRPAAAHARAAEEAEHARAASCGACGGGIAESGRERACTLPEMSCPSRSVFTPLPCVCHRQHACKRSNTYEASSSLSIHLNLAEAAAPAAMGLCQWRLERQEAVSRCKARRDMAAEHVVYLRALRAMGVALLQFASVDADHPRQIPRSRVASCGAPDRQPSPRPLRARHAALASTSRPLPARAALTSASMPPSVAPPCCVASSSPAAACFRRGGRRAPVASHPFAGRRVL
uniref:DUF630 domain-containing protein n=1 Tax=Oryza sativa subsp. japonica TaxID=39947 RepID=Q9AV59_ORYSJ|nr:hypothetical protein [Oryza sativa Japonica Group]